MSERPKFDHFQIIDILAAVCFFGIFAASAFGVKINENALMIGFPVIFVYGAARLSTMR